DRYNGVYLATRYADVRAIAYDPEHFSSKRVFVREGEPTQGGTSPITTDPPKHAGLKAVVLPAFTPQAIERHALQTREICRELVERMVGLPACDAAVDYAQEIPARVMAHMLGVPAEDGDRFRGWIHEVLDVSVTDVAVLHHTIDEMNEYFRGEAERRRAAPG